MCAKIGLRARHRRRRAGSADQGRDRLAEYTFNTRVAKHLFCAECGVKSFYRPRSNPDGWSVQRRAAWTTVEGFDSRRSRPSTAQNWEANAAGLAHPLEGARMSRLARPVPLRRGARRDRGRRRRPNFRCAPASVGSAAGTGPSPPATRTRPITFRRRRRAHPLPLRPAALEFPICAECGCYVGSAVEVDGRPVRHPERRAASPCPGFDDRDPADRRSTTTRRRRTTAARRKAPLVAHRLTEPQLSA